MSKQYGLNFPKQITGHQLGQVSTKKPSIFDNDSDTEETQVRPTGISRGIKKQDELSREKAVADDPTVFQYDEVYEDIEKTRNESKLSRKDLDKKPKYISKLLIAAEKRKRENDRRIERQVQKEREEEGDTFKDKESFITPSYKKKLEELREIEEQEKRDEYLESIGDVRKQGNLDGFYRHLYDQKVNFKEEDKTEIDDKTSKEDNTVKNENTIKTEINSSNEELTEEKSIKPTKKRKYRSRRNSEEDNNPEETVEIKKEHLPSNIDADSDFSVDSSDTDEEETVKKPETPKTEVHPTTPPPLPEENSTKKEPKEPKIKPKKEKIDVWKKRTVGDKFDEAVKRYFERKAIREMGQ